MKQNSTINKQSQQPFYNDNLPSGFDYNVNVDISSNSSSNHNDKESNINDKDSVNNFRPTDNSNKSLIHLHPFESIPIKGDYFILFSDMFRTHDHIQR